MHSLIDQHDKDRQKCPAALLPRHENKRYDNNDNFQHNNNSPWQE